MNFSKLLLTFIVTLYALGAKASEESVIIDFLNNRFGMFIHYNMSQFHGEQWASQHAPKSFDPKMLDCAQWAKIAKSAKMNYAVLTTKHHDGFCLWDSKVTDYDVASSPYKKDIVKQYADAFRNEGINVGLYFSIWDRHQLIEKGNVKPKDVEFIKAQLTELLTSYGEVVCLVIDGWGSVWGQSPTFQDIEYSVIADHVHSIQPNCLVINHSCMPDRAVTQLVHYEATHGQHCPNNNSIPSQQGPTIQPKWFWEDGNQDLELKPLSEILSELDFCNSRCANYLLNASPNVDGYMDDNVAHRLREVGETWKMPKPLKKLPKESEPNEGVIATGAHQGDNVAANVLDANLFTYWQAVEEEKNPTIIIDFGKNEEFNKVVCGEGKGKRGIQAFKIEALIGSKWKEIAQGDTMGNHWEAHLDNVKARKFKVTVTKYNVTPKILEVTFVKYNDIL